MRKGETTRGHILTKALALASEVGLSGISIGALAERVSMSKSGLFAHFASKEKLQLAILEDAISRFLALVVIPALKEPRGEPRVTALFERWLDWGDQDFMPGGCIFVAAAVELDDQEGPARERLVSSQKDWLETLCEAARIAVREKHFRGDLDCEQFAFDTYGIAHAYYISKRLLRDPKSRRRARASFERLLMEARSAPKDTK